MEEKPNERTITCRKGHEIKLREVQRITWIDRETGEVVMETKGLCPECCVEFFNKKFGLQ
jgi:hypothetical protein